MFNEPVFGRKPASFTAANWSFLAVALLVVSFLALGTHDLAIAHLGIPYPYDDDVPGWARLVGQAVQIGSLVLICAMASWFLDRRRPLAAAAIIGLTLMLLNESLRVLVIHVALVDGWKDKRGAFEVVDAAPKAIGIFFNGAAGLLIARYLLKLRSRAFIVPVAVTALSAAGLWLLPPLLHAGAHLVEDTFELVDPDQVYQMPFGLYIYQFIYGMFVEPTIATFFIAYLVWPVLSGGIVKRVVIFSVMILLVRGRVVAIVLFSHWIRQPAALAFAAEGQFFVETSVMAALVGYAWAIVANDPASTPRRMQERKRGEPCAF